MNQYFDKIFWINSKNRVDRFKNMIIRLDGLGIRAERFSAIHGGEIDFSDPDYNYYTSQNIKKSLNNAEIGCFLSHRTIYKEIKKNGWKKTLILEDDCDFCPDFLALFEKIYKEVPEYEMLYLGQWNYDVEINGNKGETFALKNRVASVGNRDLYEAERCWLTHAYAVDLSVIDTLLDNTTNLYASVDQVLADIQAEKKLKVYAIHPAIIKQDGTRSSLR